ncbi:hypothetical protein [Streptomyces sp. NPDC001568]|uniref:hypothetical protein n=1 Tax=Streptomyces sp. NPDC001568 TaxID=3364588 RepID=UPI0036A9CD9E
MSHRTSLRHLVIGACTAALAAGSGLLALPAQAETGQAPAAVAARATRAELAVDHFVNQYVFAIQGTQSEGKDSLTIRKELLTAELDEALTVWGSEHQTDPVFRYNAVPKESKVVTAGTTIEGHEKVIVTETFEDGTVKDVWYQVNLATMVIDGLQDPTA